MRTSLPAVSTPETLLMNIALIELAHSYGIPALSVGYVTDARQLGFRGGVEDMALALFTKLAHPDILIGLGTLAAGEAVSFEKMLLDGELSEYLDRVLEGLTIDDRHLSMDVISRVGPGGHFLAQRETRQLFRGGEHWIPSLFDRAVETHGRPAQSEFARAKVQVTRVLDEHRPPTLSPEDSLAVAEVLARAEAALRA